MKGVLIGAGYFAQFQAEAWKRLEGHLLIRTAATDQSGSAAGTLPPQQPLLLAVADLAPGKAKQFAAKHGIPRAYESAEAMFDAEQPDFVDIATRPESHLPLTRLAAPRGIHVICQKPMAPTMPDCIAMCAVCEQSKVRLLIHENWRWQPWYREAKRLIDAGTLGSLRHLRFDWHTGDGQGPAPYAAQPYFPQMPHLLIYETLVHILDTFRFLAGELRVTDCATRRINPVIAGEDWAEIGVAFDTGAAGFIHGDRHTGPVPAPIAMGSMVLEGDRATLRIASDGQMFLRATGAAAVLPPAERSAQVGGWKAAPPTEEKLPFTAPTTGYKGDSVLATQQHLLESLSRGQLSESEGRDYLKTVALVEECYRLSPQPVASSL